FSPLQDFRARGLPDRVGVAWTPPVAATAHCAAGIRHIDARKKHASDGSENRKSKDRNTRQHEYCSLRYTAIEWNSTTHISITLVARGDNRVHVHVQNPTYPDKSFSDRKPHGKLGAPHCDATGSCDLLV